MRKRVFTNAPWEKKAAYCRAIRVGDTIAVTGTVAVDDDGKPVAPGDPGAQADRCFALIERALSEVGAGLHDVVRTRMFVTDISRWEPVAAAHERVFRDHPPATTMVEVSGLIDPAFLVEIEADAILE